jgi:general nucleoside transport system ATP-binding protein
MMDRAPVAVRLGARNLTRKFGSVVANDRVDLAVAPGTIHAIVGGNGAGKSTLMRVLQAVEAPDEGTVILNDAPVRLSGPADAFRHGVGMVHQEFMLAPNLTLLENLILAQEPLGAGGLIDWRAAQAEADRLAALAGVALDWRLVVSDAPVHQRQILEILRLLYRGADVLILDEPTAVLAPAQVAELIALMRRLKGEGRTLLFISHKLDEVLEVADVITVMRAGRVVATTTPAQTTKAELAGWMVGAPVETARTTPVAEARRGAPLFSAVGLVARDRRGLARLGPIDLEISAGEIVGIAGVAGNGQDELAACAAGLGSVAAGRIVFAGADLTQGSAREFRAAGVGYLSADRAEEGLCLDASIRDNFIAGREQDPPFSRGGLLRPAAIAASAEAALARLSVRYRRLTDAARSLSGGNQQRVAIAREFERRPKLLVAAQPTRGVDIAGIAFIHGQIAAFRDGGGAVLLISEELDEILELSDRIVGLYGGRITGELARAEASVEKIGRLMLGQKAA